MTSKLITNSLKLILILMLIYGLFELVYSHAAELTVPSDVRTETMILDPQNPAFTPPCACAANEEGRIFYNDKNNDNKLYYCDGATWKLFNPEKTVATKIVSAYNSSGATRDGTNVCVGDGTTCNNPKADYTCDGTDDQEKINQAINDLPSVGGVSYGVVYLLEGTYTISATALPSPQETLSGIVLHSNAAIIGTGRGTVLKVKLNESNVNVINAQNVQKILISQLMIDGNSKTGSLNTGIYFSSVTYSKIDKLWVENMSDNGIYFTSSSNNTISSNNIQSNGFYGIGFLSNSNNNIISGNNIQGNIQHGIYLGPGSNNTIANNNIQSNSASGICLYNPSNNNTISNNNIQSNSTYGIYIMQGYYNVISNNNIQSNSQFGICLADGDSSIVSGNNIQGNIQHGIYTSGAGGSIITANVIYDNGSGGAFDGINLNDNNIIISSNRIYDSSGTGYGIKISGSNNYLIGNLIDGAGYDAGHLIQDLGTGTKYTDKAKLTFEQAASQDPSSGGTINATSTYIPLNPTTSPGYAIGNITDGKSGGDLLILENINATNYITIPNGASANTRLSINGSPSQIQLSQNDTLSLIWDGNGTAGVGDWVEIGYSDNSP